jgi:hypothetical protein
MTIYDKIQNDIQKHVVVKKPIPVLFAYDVIGNEPLPNYRDNFLSYNRYFLSKTSPGISFHISTIVVLMFLCGVSWVLYSILSIVG